MRTAFSDSHRYVAFGYDLNNNEYVRWMVKDTKGSRILGVKGWQANVLEDAGEVVFYQDKALFYTKTHNRRPHQLYYQEFDGEPQLIL
jgi:protease II